MDDTEFRLSNGTQYCPNSGLKILKENEVGQLISRLKLCSNDTLVWARVAFKEEGILMCFVPLTEEFEDCEMGSDAATFALCNITTNSMLVLTQL